MPVSPTTALAQNTPPAMKGACRARTALGWVGILAVSAMACRPSPSQAATYYVDAASVPKEASGLSPQEAFPTIQAACDVVRPGDTVTVSRGVYFGTICLKTAGLTSQPITFRADGIERGRVVLTTADPAIRTKEVAWTLVDSTLGLYAVPHAEKPARVLYDGVDLLPFPSLSTLRRFRFDNGYPGTQQGFAFDKGQLFVRLHASGRYGGSNPNDHLMAVAPAGRAEERGPAVDVRQSTDYIWGIETAAPSHVILDGFTFETPAIAAVYVPDGDVVVRNCWFLGCRSGVAGRNAVPDATQNTDRVVIEHCDFSQHPAFDDMLEVIEVFRNDPWREDQRQLMQRIYWWQRKGDQPGGGIGYDTTYESGMATSIGNDWVIRRNHIHDALEALSTWGTDHSVNLQVYENRIERILDNAVECENRAVNLTFRHNEVVDVFEPFSWQPLRAVPWPGPATICSNLVLTTSSMQGVWKSAGHTPGIWKLGASEKNWLRKDIRLDPEEPVRVPGSGFLAFNNTVVSPGSVAITRIQSQARAFENFNLSRNLFVLDDLSTLDGDCFPNMQFAGNTGIFLSPRNPVAAAIFTKADDIQNDGPGAVPPGCSWRLPPVGPVAVSPVP